MHQSKAILIEKNVTVENLIVTSSSGARVILVELVKLVSPSIVVFLLYRLRETHENVLESSSVYRATLNRH